MRIVTKDFGEIEVPPESIITFPNGLFAFEQWKEFVLLNYDFAGEDSPIKCLQSSDGDISFTVVDPFYFLPDYRPNIKPPDLNCIDGKADDQKLRYLVIAVVGNNFKDTVVNLRSPIVVNTANRKAAQVILEGDEYPLKYRLFAIDE